MQNNIVISDYIKPDNREELARKTKDKTLSTIMEEHRGIYLTSNDQIRVSARIFADYILAYRIDLRRLDTGKRLIKNQTAHIYETVSDTTLQSICMKIMDEYNAAYYEKVREDSLLGFIDKQAKSYRKLDVDLNYLLFPNGIYDLEKFTFDSQFQRNAVVTYVMGFVFESNADCPVWKKALQKMFPDDQQALIDVVQEMFGYTFEYGAAPADTLFYLYGTGRNGKSILSFVLRKLHGEDNIAGTPLSGLSERFNLSAVWDKKVCICPENAQEKLLDTSTLKALTGRDAIKVEKKYETPFTATLTTKIVVNSNHYLRTDDNSVGFWERILPIPFEVTFLSKAEWEKKPDKRHFRVRDTKLEKKLEHELPGIFNWAMEGLQRLRKNQWVFSESEKVMELKKQMMFYSKPVLAFVTQCIRQGSYDKKKGKTDRIPSSEVQKKFLTWAETNDLETAEYRNARKFRRAFLEGLKEQGITAEVKKNSTDVYVGIVVDDRTDRK